MPEPGVNLFADGAVPTSPDGDAAPPDVPPVIPEDIDGNDNLEGNEGDHAPVDDEYLDDPTGDDPAPEGEGETEHEFDGQKFKTKDEALEHATKRMSGKDDEYRKLILENKELRAAHAQPPQPQATAKDMLDEIDRRGTAANQNAAVEAQIAAMPAETQPIARELLALRSENAELKGAVQNINHHLQANAQKEQRKEAGDYITGMRTDATKEVTDLIEVEYPGLKDEKYAPLRQEAIDTSVNSFRADLGRREFGGGELLKNKLELTMAFVNDNNKSLAKTQKKKNAKTGASGKGAPGPGTPQKPEGLTNLLGDDVVQRF